MTTTMITSLIQLPSRLPIPYRPPPETTSPTALQTLAFEIVGVLFAGAGLILLVLQLRGKYAKRADPNTDRVELDGVAGGVV